VTARYPFRPAPSLMQSNCQGAGEPCSLAQPLIRLTSDVVE
jgi:hypothetical protein